MARRQLDPKEVAWRKLRKELLLPETPWARKVMSDSLTYQMLVLSVAWVQFKKALKGFIPDVMRVIRTGER